MDNNSLWIIIGLPVFSLLIGITSSYVGQLFFAPRAEERGRRRERWDNYAADLGSTIIGDFVSSGSSWHAAASKLRGALDDWTDELVGDSVLEAAVAEYHAAFQGLYGVGMRITWLSDRLLNGGGAPSDKLDELAKADHRWSVVFEKALNAAELARLSPTEAELARVATHEEIASIGQELLDAGTDLNMVVSKVADGKHRRDPIAFVFRP